MIQVGDTVFDRSGHPGVIVSQDPATETVKVQRQGEKFEKTRRSGYINGLNPKDRKSFEGIISEVKQQKDPKEKVKMMQEKIAELKLDPRNHIVTRYVEGEMAHIMNTEKINPREFTVSTDSVRS